MNSEPSSPNPPKAVKPLSGPLRWTKAVAESPLPAGQKLVLYALADNINFTSWRIWACKETIRRATGHKSVRTVDASMKALEGVGVLKCIARSEGGAGPDGRGRTNEYRVDVEVLERMNPAIHDSEPRNPRHRTPQPLRGNRPSIHNRPIEQSIHGAKPMAGESAQAACMDGSEPSTSLRGFLIRCGVQGPNLDTIADNPRVALAAVQAEWDRIRRDSRVRKPAAVLVKRLNDLYQLGLRGRLAASRSVLQQNDELMRRRAREQARGSPSSIASALPEQFTSPPPSSRG